MTFRLLPILFLVLTTVLRGNDTPTVTVEALPSPAGPGAVTPQFATAPDGTVYLSWIEPAGADAHRLRLARFDAAARTWSAPRTIAEGRDWFVNWADTPQIGAAPGGRLVAVWFVNNPDAGGHDHHGAGYGALVSFSDDDGATWTAPAPLSRESDRNEFVALKALSDGRWLATWLDGRAVRSGGAMQLYGRVLSEDGPDQLIDDRVCDCCPTSLVALPDGSALVAYRDRSPTEVRDMYTARFQRGAWGPPAPIHADGWQIAACPVNGPILDVQGATVAVAWYTAAEDRPRIHATTSAEAGARFFVPAQLNDTERPLGRIGAVLLRDGSFWVSWLEADGSITVRRLSPGGGASTAVSLRGGAGEASRAGGIPRLALVKDYDEQPARLILARTVPGEPSQLTLHLLTLPDADDLAAADCGCDPRTSDVRSYPVRGRIITPLPERGTLLVRHSEVPGVMRAMTMEFKVDPETLAAAREGRDIFARMEKRADGSWWLTDVRMLMRPGESP